MDPEEEWVLALQKQQSPSIRMVAYPDANHELLRLLADRGAAYLTVESKLH